MNRFQRYTGELRRLIESEGEPQPGLFGPLGTIHGVPAEDPEVVAQEWLREKQRTSAEGMDLDRAEWDEYAKRRLLSPDAAALGWSVIAGRPQGIAGTQVQPPDPSMVFTNPYRQSREARCEELKRRLGEGVPLGGYYGINPGPNMPLSDAPGYPFSTEAAERVWRIARSMISAYPDVQPQELMMLAIQKARIDVYELTPEDGRMLELAISTAQNGAVPGVGNRKGGAPGGPFNSNDGAQYSGGGLPS